MNVGDTVRLNLVFGPSDRYRVMATLGAMPYERGPLKLRLKSEADGHTIYDYPSSLVTKEEH